MGKRPDDFGYRVLRIQFCDYAAVHNNGAPDVAFTEAVIGVISTVYFIIILRQISRKAKDSEERRLRRKKKEEEKE